MGRGRGDHTSSTILSRITHHHSTVFHHMLYRYRYYAYHNSASSPGIVPRHHPDILEQLLENSLILIVIVIPLETARTISSIQTCYNGVQHCRTHRTHLGINVTASSNLDGLRYMIWAISNLFKKPGLAASALTLQQNSMEIHSRSHRFYHIHRRV